MIFGGCFLFKMKSIGLENKIGIVNFSQCLYDIEKKN